MVFDGGIEQDRLILSAAPYCPTVLAIEFRARLLLHIPRFEATPSHRTTVELPGPPPQGGF